MIKNRRTRFMLAFVVLLPIAAAPLARAKVRFPRQNPLSVSVEMGRYDPEPECKKDVDGCFPKLWVPANEFKSGTRVWMRVTVTNHSKLFAGISTGIEPMWIHSVVDAAGKETELTKEGCWRRNPKCPIPDDRPPRMNTVAFPETWEIPSAANENFGIEVSRYFVLLSPGEYALSSVVFGFRLLRKEFLPLMGPIDEKHSKPVAKLTLRTLRFVIVK